MYKHARAPKHYGPDLLHALARLRREAAELLDTSAAERAEVELENEIDRSEEDVEFDETVAVSSLDGNNEGSGRWLEPKRKNRSYGYARRGNSWKNQNSAEKAYNSHHPNATQHRGSRADKRLWLDHGISAMPFDTLEMARYWTEVMRDYRQKKAA